MRRALALALISGALLVAGCKEPPKPPRPTPTHTPTPEPLSDLIAFTEAGALHTVVWKGDQRTTLYRDRANSIWFPSAANPAAQGIAGPAGRSGPHFLAWLSEPGGSQNVVRVYLDGSVVPLTSINTRSRSEMKNLRLGNTPEYSHDGKRIAFSHNGNIWIMDSDGYNAVTLIADGNSWSPAWSQDDKKIVYVNVFQGRSDIWVTNIDDKDTYQVTDFDGYTVGQPRFSPDDHRIILTRIQKDESDVVSVLAAPDQPLADAEPVSRDRQSGNAVYSPDGLRIVFASGPKNPFKPDDAKTLEENKEIDPLTWYIWRAMPDGSKPLRLAQARGVSPAWLRSETLKPKPTEAPTPKPKPTSAPTKAATPGGQQGGATGTTGTTASTKPTPPPKPGGGTTKPPPKPTQVAAKPTPKPALSPAGGPKTTAVPTQPKRPTQAPTQPAAEAAALRIKLGVKFDPATDALTQDSLPSVQKIAARARQYPPNLIIVYGPLDSSPLRGAYPSPEARSKARAEKVAAVIAKTKGVQPSQIKTVPFVPAGLGSKPLTNGILIYLNLK